MNDVSQRIIKNLSMDVKKEQGIYFTPSSVALELFKKVPIIPKSILEPSCGAGGFLKILPKSITTGIELNKYIYDETKSIHKNVINMDFLQYDKVDKHDLIIGNPPYFTTMTKYDSDLLYGRNNMYVLFIIHSMKLLKNDGVIAFIIPTNFMNSSYYNKLRKEVYTNWTIHQFVRYDDIFEETKQKVFGLIIQKSKTKNNTRHVFIVNDNYYFVFSKKNLPSSRYMTLNDLGYQAKVGSIQWGANKKLFSNDRNGTMLVYAGDIMNHGVMMKNKEYRFMKRTPSLNGPIIVVNRGYGNVKYEMRASYFNPKFKFQLENHVLYIKHKDGKPNKAMMKRIARSLQSKETKEFIDKIFMNNGINATELQNIIPLFM